MDGQHSSIDWIHIWQNNMYSEDTVKWRQLVHGVAKPFIVTCIVSVTVCSLTVPWNSRRRCRTPSRQCRLILRQRSAKTVPEPEETFDHVPSPGHLGSREISETPGMHTQTWQTRWTPLTNRYKNRWTKMERHFKNTTMTAHWNK